ncbi:MAG: methyltransferase domain-containing protein [Acidimicrobiia bacterium]
MSWDPDRYLRFADHRARPGAELLARVPEIDARQIVDLGCGTGSLTALLARRWPAAHVAGVDASAEMVERAHRDHHAITWTIGDIATWAPDEPIDLIFSNAALHWVDNHERLFGRLRSFLADDSVLAAQMPDNWDAPTHRIPAEVLDSGCWPDAARTALMRDRLSPAEMYARWVQPATVDMWRTTYFHHLSGDNPVWAWVTGSVLRPVLAKLDPASRDRFAQQCKTLYRAAYPADSEGTTTLPFSRLFVIAQAM